jgi:hypothetical protein
VLGAGDRVRGEGRVREHERDFACPDREIRVEPTEGVLVCPVLVALNRRRAGCAWSGAVRRAASSDVERSRSRGVGHGARAEGSVGRQRASEVSLVRSSFLSRWAQEVGGRGVVLEITRPRRTQGAEARMA